MVHASKMPPTRFWHDVAPQGEFRARDAGMSFEDYLALEEKLFASLDEYMIDVSVLDGQSPHMRYVRGSVSDPASKPVNWNRSFVLEPDGEPVGGVLLVHGLTDSPYSMLSIARLYQQRGFVAVGLRLPGHGTVPAGMRDANRRDWRAAVSLAADYVRGRVGDKPVHLVGYSMGGTLVLHDTLDRIKNDEPVADRIVLLSPAIGVTHWARVSSTYVLVTWIPGFDRGRWLGIEPELDPYKYSSFARHGSSQVYWATIDLKKALARAAKTGRIDELPPILTFQSVVDATIIVRDTESALYRRIDDERSELVLFDVNNAADFEGLFKQDFSELLRSFASSREFPYRLTLITNVDPGSDRVVARTKPPGSGESIDRPLDLEWPAEVYSMSHTAVPFPIDDPVYGQSPGEESFIGNLPLRGEKQVLRIPSGSLLRLRHNPFHPYMVERINEAIDEDLAGP